MKRWDQYSDKFRMGQVDVINCLEKAGKPLGRAEIAMLTGISVNHVSHTLNRLLKHNEIKCVEIDRHKAKELFNVCRRMMLYYI